MASYDAITMYGSMVYENGDQVIKYWCALEDVLMQKIGSEFTGVRKDAWTPEEDLLLKKCVEKHGEGRWHLVPTQAGRIPDRTANDIKNFWNTCLGKKVSPNLQGVVDNKETAGSTAMEPLKHSSPSHTCRP
ncbi:hypothetical protein Taro_042690 [Colocasia esculenta]|uniref:Uncharacterized protein n=1 Tax=Colocasia esculenta TaxID=4460 RepID=A0A843WJ14_COLES|nr:hypothetical protein [Colocasia esculenta]